MQPQCVPAARMPHSTILQQKASQHHLGLHQSDSTSDNATHCCFSSPADAADGNAQRHAKRPCLCRCYCCRAGVATLGLLAVPAQQRSRCEPACRTTGNKQIKHLNNHDRTSLVAPVGSMQHTSCLQEAVVHMRCEQQLARMLEPCRLAVERRPSPQLAVASNKLSYMAHLCQQHAPMMKGSAVSTVSLTLSGSPWLTRPTAANASSTAKSPAARRATRLQAAKAAPQALAYV